MQRQAMSGNVSAGCWRTHPCLTSSIELCHQNGAVDSFEEILPRAQMMPSSRHFTHSLHFFNQKSVDATHLVSKIFTDRRRESSMRRK